MSEWDIFGCQQVAADGSLKYHKVNGEENPSDACTKHLAGERLRKLVARDSAKGRGERKSRSACSLRGLHPADSPGCRKASGQGGVSAHLDPQQGSLTWL